jgi:hypothetical protein
MVEYRVTGAELLSAAVITVCFVVALIVITMQEASRSRTFGVVGVAFLFASTAAQAINESLGSAYGTKTVVYAVGSIVVAALASTGLVLLALAVVWARKARRRRGDH